MKVPIPGYGDCDGDGPIVILGPNGSGKTKLAQEIGGHSNVTAIGAQRRTWVSDAIPAQEETSITNHIRGQQDNWRGQSWQPTNDIDHVISRLIQRHTDALTRNNASAMQAKGPVEPVTDTGLIQLQQMWGRLFPTRELIIGGFFPKVKRTDLVGAPTYTLKEMSDGERTVLYMAARVLSSDTPIILVDEPELHMHSRLSVAFWTEAEKLRPKCRFVYITHDLNFALSRRDATVFTIQPDGKKVVSLEAVSSDVVAQVLGAATLPFYANRIVFYEGEPGKGFASQFLSAWFNDAKTFAIPTGNRDSVLAAVAGLRAVGVAAAEIVGLVDRDFYSDEALTGVPDGTTVLPVHEIEAVLCNQNVVSALAQQLGRNPEAVWSAFVTRIRQEFSGQTLNRVVAQRVRFRVRDLLDGAYGGTLIDHDLTVTSQNHSAALDGLDLASRAGKMFAEEAARVQKALHEGDKAMLAVLPGKHLLALLPSILGFKGTGDLTELVVRALGAGDEDKDEPMKVLRGKLEAAISELLPSRGAQVTADLAAEDNAQQPAASPTKAI